MDEKKEFISVDEYIKEFPKEVQDILGQIREVVRKAAPEAVERISYQMPTYTTTENLVHFAAFKSHIGLYPAPSGITTFQEELAPYKSAKGPVRFPLDKPIPYDLIKRIVLFRVEEAKTKKDGNYSRG